MQQTQSGQILGTPSFMSPEQALGKHLDHRTDIFSLGVVLYELTTGQRPFTGASFAEILDKIVHAQPTAIARLNYDVPPELERTRSSACRNRLIAVINQRGSCWSTCGTWPGSSNLARRLCFGVVRSPEASHTFARNLGGIAAEPFSLEKLKTSDVLLNYVAIDDYPLHDGKPGWVSQLHRNLEVRMEQLSGEKVQSPACRRMRFRPRSRPSCCCTFPRPRP